MNLSNARRVHRQHSATVPRLHPAMWSILLLGMCIGLLSAVIGGTFTVRRVEVIGAGGARNAAVAAAGVLGHNIFRVRSDEVARRVGTIPAIVVLRVETAFPDRVTIYTRARTAMVAWRTARGLFLVDPDGRVIGRASTTTLPVISGGGSRGHLGAGTVMAVRYAVQTLPRLQYGAVAAFQFAPGKGLTIVGRSGWTAIVGTGSPQALVNRIATFAAYLRRIGPEAQTRKTIDLRYRTGYATNATP